MTFTMARQVLVELARSFDVSPSRYSGGDRLDYAAFARLQTGLGAMGLEWMSVGDTEETLADLRATYEPLLDGLSRYLLLPLPGWMSDDRATDNWGSGHRGLIAARLVQQLADEARSPPSQVAEASASKRWKRTRGRLKR